jgi:hypothetical protein
MLQAFEVGRGQMESFEQNFNSFATTGMMDGGITWMDNITQSTVIDVESRYFDHFVHAIFV